MIGGETVLTATLVDGHGGHQAALLVINQLIEMIAEESNGRAGGGDLAAATHRSFARLHKLLLDDESHTSGTTVTVCMINETRGELTTAHVGDSAALLVLARPAAGEPACALLTTEHRLASSDAERQRVAAAGGKLGHASVGGRQAGPLRAFPGGVCCARALGDRDCGRWLSPAPHTEVQAFPASGACIVMASDGVWDALAVDAVAKVALKSKSARDAAERIVHKSYKARGLRDDITCACIVGGAACITAEPSSSTPLSAGASSASATSAAVPVPPPSAAPAPAPAATARTSDSSSVGVLGASPGAPGGSPVGGPGGSPVGSPPNSCPRSPTLGRRMSQAASSILPSALRPHPKARGADESFAKSPGAEPGSVDPSVKGGMIFASFAQQGELSAKLEGTARSEAGCEHNQSTHPPSSLPGGDAADAGPGASPADPADPAAAIDQLRNLSLFHNTTQREHSASSSSSSASEHSGESQRLFSMLLGGPRMQLSPGANTPNRTPNGTPDHSVSGGSWHSGLVSAASSSAWSAELPAAAAARNPTPDQGVGLMPLDAHAQQRVKVPL